MISILEIGCGEGFNTYILSKKKNIRIIGIDIDKQSLKIAKKRYPSTDFAYMDVENLKFENKQFNRIYAVDVFEHFQNLNKATSEITRVLKKGGILYVNVPAEKSEKWLLKIRPSYFKEIHHVRIFKGNTLERFLEKFGLRTSKIKPQGFLQHILLYYLFTRTKKGKTQLSIGSWRDTFVSKLIYLCISFMDPFVFKTPGKYVPIWIVTLPIGLAISFIGNKVFPKSVYYEFIKE